MTRYTDEQIMIRAMPCPTCGAKPRQHCKRKPAESGIIKNHQHRQLYWHQFAKRASSNIPDDFGKSRKDYTSDRTLIDDTMVDAYDEFAWKIGLWPEN